MRPSKAERDTSFGVFMDQAGPALLRTAWFLTGDTDRAQELTQAAFVKTYVVWHKIDHDRALAYARRCLVNHKIAPLKDAKGGYALPLTVDATDAFGAAVMTGRYPTDRRVTERDGIQDRLVSGDGAPVAAGILPPGASNIDVILTTNEVANGLPVMQPLPDGRVLFAIKAEGAQPSRPSKDSIKAVTWTNLDGSKGRQDVTQQKR